MMALVIVLGLRGVDHSVLVDMMMVFDGMVVLVGLSYHCGFLMVGQNK
jgi:hypothetical protein